MRPTTRWLIGSVLAVAGTGCSALGRDGSVPHRQVVDGVPQPALSGGRGERSPAPGRGTERRSASRSADDGIAADFLHALAQLDGYAPDEATVRFTRRSMDADPLVAALERRMRARGYAVRVVDDGAAAEHVRHVVQDDEAPGATVHTLSVGGVQMRRSYRTDATGGLTSAGSLFVRGADASGIRMDRPLGGDEPAAVPAPAPRRQPADLVAEADRAGHAAPLAASLAAPLPAPLAIDATSGKPVWSGLAPTSMPRPARPRDLPRNLLELGGSNFDSVFGDYGDVEELILTFANDSLDLGTRNKARIRRVLDDFDAGSDSFSIVGCSLGETDVAHGNEALALGRANRVKEELLFAGVPRANIFAEGCWAMEATAKFPSRGVVLTHKRRKDA